MASQYVVLYSSYLLLHNLSNAFIHTIPIFKVETIIHLPRISSCAKEYVIKISPHLLLLHFFI